MLNKISNIIKNETKQRKDAIIKLNSYLTNPGRFSILILGSRGTGKAHWLKEIQSLHKEDDKNLDELVFISAFNTNKYNEADWINLFKSSNNGLLVISDIEELNKESQGLLFNGISTGQGGMFGFKEKKFKIRIAFTSTKDITTLRDNETFLTHKFFDRICQFAVKMPTFQEANIFIWEDFQKSWDKMSFQNHNEYPEDLKIWLKKLESPLYGNFRDLDKLAINWHNYRLLGKKEDKILALVREDFFNYYHYPEHKTDINSTFEISKSCDWDGNLKKFRLFYKNYIKNKYGTLRKGEKESKMSYRTMEKW
ncbi:sigma 54-interacting transcriptional regulator [Algibacter sp. L4_22]|uniref:sigma 54-interacting transcriptional regulator n=1 Tax=Algibacter sp. L4_22 TaxID=2942477 RepID=UPI00201B964B|nr:sigma 54-interacting transcriptional regulator [Algibacter sp. L4_22]MCL5129350.1 sigma 54-interacting transcriptional regulator [Algibacter sp. L4_22]